MVVVEEDILGAGDISVGCVQFQFVRDHYKLEDELGNGRFGVVRRCRSRVTGEKLACKSICKTKLKKKTEVRDLRTEISVMKNLRGHPNIVSLHDVFEESRSVHMIMDLCQSKDLFDYITARKKLPEKDAAEIIRQIALGVKHCHENGVIHRDLKPENILFDRIPERDGSGTYAVKIADFGLASVCTPPFKVVGMAGSPFYMAPEVIKRKPYGFEIDIWSMGVILYAILSGCLPFWGANQQDTFSAICQCQPDFGRRPWRSISVEAKSLVKQMLTFDPSDRATIAEILRHPWLQSQHCDGPLAPAAPKRVARVLTEIPSFHFGQEFMRRRSKDKRPDSQEAEAASSTPSSTPSEKKERFLFGLMPRRLLFALTEQKSKADTKLEKVDAKLTQTSTLDIKTGHLVAQLSEMATQVPELSPSCQEKAQQNGGAEKLGPEMVAAIQPNGGVLTCGHAFQDEGKRESKDYSSQQSTPRKVFDFWAVAGDYQSTSSDLSPQPSLDPPRRTLA